VVSVFSALGGVGKTTVAINLAAALPGKKVCVIDCDLQYGDVCRYLDIRPKRTLADMAACSTDRQVSDYAVPWRGHADIFACPQTVEEAGLVNAGAIGNIIKALKAQYETLIVDLPAGFGETALEVLDLSDRILLIGSAAAIPDIRSTKVALEILRSLGHAEKVTLILNRHNARHGIDVRKVEEVLGCRFSLKLSNDFAATTQAIRSGVPLTEGQPGKSLSRELARLAQDILSDAAGPAGKLSLTEKISRLFAPRQKGSLNA
jgi:pilus assembly protein CpaE